MKLRTEIDIKPFDEKIEFASRIFTIGSCFAQSIGERMERSKFRATVNPTGTLFNPISIAATIERLCECRYIAHEELRCGDEGWYHDQFHSSLNASTAEGAEGAMERINRAIELSSQALCAADWVVITLGTAWIYERTESGEVVANCHKEPARNFVRRRVGVCEIVNRLSEVVERHLCGKRIVLTLSPIRHIADGLDENSVSKATLRLAIEELVTKYRGRIYYFPSYEILIDDLRDYRFYGADMVHPSSVAVDYIWDRFCEATLSNSAKATLPKVMKIVKAAEHRPSNPYSPQHAELCRRQLEAIEALPEVDFGKESAYFKINL